MKCLFFLICFSAIQSQHAQQPNSRLKPSIKPFESKVLSGNPLSCTLFSHTEIPSLIWLKDFASEKKIDTNNHDKPELYTVNTLTGSNKGSGILLNSPTGITTDTSGNIYLADALTHTIKKIDPSGVVSVLAGNGHAGYADGRLKAMFCYPTDVAIDLAGNVYVADKGNHKIRKIITDGTVTTLAGSGRRGHVDGHASLACFDKPVALALDATGNIYVADQSNHDVRKITPDGMVSTFAGCSKPGNTDGDITKASFNNPSGIALDNTGNIYVADNGNNRIRKITADSIVSTLAGSDVFGSTDGVGVAATFFSPRGIATDAAGNVYVADEVNNKIRKVSPQGIVSTIAGTGKPGNGDGVGSEAAFFSPADVAVNSSGHIYVADYSNAGVRVIKPKKVIESSATNNIFRRKIFFSNRNATSIHTTASPQF